MLYGELGRYPISVVVKSRMIAFWNRIVTGKTSKPSYCIYNYTKNQPNTELKWIIQIKHILNNAGSSDLWLNQRNVTDRQIHKYIKQIYIDQYKQTWSSQLIESEKGRTYSNFKNSLELESYFQLLSNHDALTLLEFRTANFKLAVETGRYESVPYEDRTCRLCTDDTAGSEVHYLFECRSLSAERAHFFAALG